MAYTKYSLTPANNNATPPDGAPEGMLPSAVNDTMRDMMAQIRDCGDGIRDGTYTMTAPKITGGTITGAAFTGNTFTSPVISGGSINNTPIGASTANTGAFTTLSASGAFSANGGATLGDASGDALTINSSAVSIPNGLNFDSNTFVIDATNNRVGVNNATPTTALDVTGTATISTNLAFTGTGNRITGDFSNATFANRVAFQTSTANSATTVLAIPSGTGTTASWDAYNNSDPTNSGYAQLTALSTEIRVAATIRGTGTYLPLTMYTGGSERLRIDTSGNVGIGTSSPSYRLHTNGGDVYFQGANVFLQDDTKALVFGTGTTSYIIGSSTNNNQRFITNSAERMRIDSSGNVGIGVSSPGQKLDVSTTNDIQLRLGNAATGAQFTYDIGRVAATGLLQFYGNQSGATGYIFSGVNGERMRIDSNGNVGIGTATPGSQKLHVRATSPTEPMVRAISVTPTGNGVYGQYNAKYDGTASDWYFGQGSTGAWSFWNNDGSVNERMRITSGGELLVGTTDTNPNSGNGVKISAGTAARTSMVGSADTNANFAITVYSSSPAAYRFQVGYGGTIYATSTSITAISDATLKTNVKDLETGLTEIMALQPRRFDWINGDATNVAGFIAQEVQQVLPDLVEDYQYSDNETKLGLKMGDILPTLVKAIQEQQAMIEELKQEVALLKSK